MALYSGRSICSGVATITATLRIVSTVLFIVRNYETVGRSVETRRKKRRGGNGVSGIAISASEARILLNRVYSAVVRDRCLVAVELCGTITLLDAAKCTFRMQCRGRAANGQHKAM